MRERKVEFFDGYFKYVTRYQEKVEREAEL